MRYLRRQRISNKHNKNNLLPKVKIIFKRSIFIGDESLIKIPLYPHGRGGENIKNLKSIKTNYDQYYYISKQTTFADILGQKKCATFAGNASQTKLFTL